jgi:choline-glycine betaine transporter
MSKNNLSAVRKVLLTGSTVFGLSAIALVATPMFFNELLGLATNPALEWSMRMTGITLVALAGNMFAHARKGSDEGVQLAARVMMFSAFALGVLTLLLPTTLSWFTILYAAVGFSFSAAYAYFLYKAKYSLK